MHWSDRCRTDVRFTDAALVLKTWSWMSSFQTVMEAQWASAASMPSTRAFGGPSCNLQYTDIRQICKK